MVKKIVYIGYQPLTKKVEKDFYLNELTERKFDVEYWDLKKVYFPHTVHEEIDWPFIFHINTLKDLNNKLKKEDKTCTVFILVITYEARVLKLFRLLTIHNCYLAFFARGAQPIHNFQGSASIFRKLAKGLSPKKLYDFMTNKISGLYKKLGLIKPYDLIFTAGEMGFKTIGQGSQLDREKAKIVNINSFDYESFVDEKDTVSGLNKKYAVFLDEYLPFHPDFALFNIKTIPPENYFQSLNSFFDEVEKNYDVEVVIAAHPKADLYHSQNPFQGRKLFFKKTAELAKHCEFAIAHSSTSISYAILNKKPLWFLYSDDLVIVMRYYYHNITCFSTALNGHIFNIDKFKLNKTKDLSIDHSAYNHYKYNYLTSMESEEKSSPDIFCDTILNL